MRLQGPDALLGPLSMAAGALFVARGLFLCICPLSSAVMSNFVLISYSWSNSCSKRWNSKWTGDCRNSKFRGSWKENGIWKLACEPKQLLIIKESRFIFKWQGPSPQLGHSTGSSLGVWPCTTWSSIFLLMKGFILPSKKCVWDVGKLPSQLVARYRKRHSRISPKAPVIWKLKTA